MDRTELLQAIHDGRAGLEAAFARLTDDQMLRHSLDNQWSPKDLLAHLGFWERRITEIFETLRRDDVPDSVEDQMSVDALNARAYEQNRPVPLGDLRRSEHTAYENLLALVQAMSDAELFDPQHFAWTRGEPAYHWVIGNTCGHYDEHMEALLKSIEAK